MTLSVNRLTALALFVLAVTTAAPATAAEPLTTAEMESLLETIDARRQSAGDTRSVVYIDQREKEKADMVYEAIVYRDDADDRMVIMFTRPKAEAGKGYLRIGQNFFLYDPNVGKWERRTERERIAGTSSQRRDFGESTLADDFNPSYVGREKLGKFDVHRLKLEAKDADEVAYPIAELWVDAKTKNVLKVQEFALSGRLMRTSYYPKWQKLTDDAGKPVYFPKEIRIFDEVEKGERTIIVFRDVDLGDLPDDIFTKAWLESKSR